MGHALTARLVTRLLAFVYLSAFLSAAWRDQWSTLVDPATGVTPARPLSPNPAHWLLGFGSAQIDVVTHAGVVAALTVLVAPSYWPLLALCWALQLSLVNTTASWIRGYGWEWQILETTIPVALLCFTHPASSVALWLLRWLAFRVMLGAGLSKLGRNASQCWRDLTCTTTHYLTQPMPNPLALFMHAMPLWFHKCEVLLNHFVELVCPFLLLAPVRVLRLFAASLSLFYMVALMVTGNYAFIQTVTMVPLLGCLDDEALLWMWSLLPCRRCSSRRRAKGAPAAGSDVHKAAGSPATGRWRLVVVLAVAAFILYESRQPVAELMSSSPWLQMYSNWYWVNAYGVFGFVNARRLVTVLSYQDSGGTWHPLDFVCLPGSVDRRPCIVAPLLHLRFDWTTWIYTTASLERAGPQQLQQGFVPPFLRTVLERILRGDAKAMRLLGTPLESSNPPRAIRAELYEYWFSSVSELLATGHWYKRSLVEAVRPVILQK